MTDLSSPPSSTHRDSTDALPSSIRLELFVSEPELVVELSNYTEGRERNEFATRALRLGVLALKQVQARIDSDLIHREGERLLAGLETKLGTYRETLTREIAAALQQYFDPHSGRFTERVERLIKKDGELEQVLRSQVGPTESVLQRTLTAHVGEGSPIAALLATDDSNGFLAATKAAVDGIVTQQRDRILREFSLDNREGALSRLVEELSQKHAQLTHDLQGSVQEVVGEFSLDNEESALSRLVRKVEQAQQNISREFSLDAEQSALARMRRELMGELEKYSAANDRFQREVVGALQALQARKAEAQRSTTHGQVFEDAVFSVVLTLAQRAGDIAEQIGWTPGLIERCKVGDAVVTLGQDSAAAGAKIVVEAKESAAYDLPKSLGEIEVARKNRGAAIGLFVHSKRTAPAGLAPLTRYGQDIVVVWDAEDAASDVALQAGLSVAKALSVRQQTHDKEQKADIEAAERAIREIEKQLAGFEEIATSAKTIANGSEKIQKRVCIMQESLQRQIAYLDAAVRHLQSVATGGMAQ